MTRLPKGTLIAGFPGIGKTTASAHPRVLDLESSEYLFELPDRPLTRLEIESLPRPRTRTKRPRALRRGS